MENPYQSPETSSQIEEAFDAGAREYEGIRRLPYFCVVLGLGFVQFMVIGGILFVVGGSSGIEAVLALFAILLLFPVHARLKNIGSNPTWCFLVFIPFLNLLLLLRCQICPEGYADTGKLDTEGKVMTGLAVVFFLFLTLGISAALMGAPVPG